jgi:hypothetical protein
VQGGGFRVARPVLGRVGQQPLGFGEPLQRQAYTRNGGHGARHLVQDQLGNHETLVLGACIQMTSLARKWLLTGLAGLSLCLQSVSCMASAVVFARNEEGVWLVSDSLEGHSDGSQTTYSHRCKVVISRGRLIFNVGHFKDLLLLRSQEADLPFENIDVTKNAITKLLETNHMDMSGDPKNAPNLLVVNTGIVQVEDSIFQARMIGQMDSMQNAIRFIKDWKMGFPHGMGDATQLARDESLLDPEVAARIMENPKTELMKIMMEEVKSRPDEVGGPFTILLLHSDGTISDFSDNSLCRVPPDVVHKLTPICPHHRAR